MVSVCMGHLPVRWSAPGARQCPRSRHDSEPDSARPACTGCSSQSTAVTHNKVKHFKNKPKNKKSNIKIKPYNQLKLWKKKECIIGRSCHKYHFCHDKTFVAADTCLPRQTLLKNMLAAIKLCLLFCCNKTFVMTNICQNNKHNFIAASIFLRHVLS